MANDLFGGLGGLGSLFGGIAKSVVPKDTPEGKLLAAQSDVSDLQKQETDIFLEIGRKAYELDPAYWPQHSKLQLIRQNLDAAQATLDRAQAEMKQAEAAQAAEDAKGRCPECGHKNPEGIRFCQECGNSLVTQAPKHCASCGAQLTPGIRFCGECGTQRTDM